MGGAFHPLSRGKQNKAPLFLFYFILFLAMQAMIAGFLVLVKRILNPFMPCYRSLLRSTLFFHFLSFSLHTLAFEWAISGCQKVQQETDLQ